MSETPPSGAGSGSDEESAVPAVDWSSLIADWTTYSHELVDRLSTRASENAGLARNGGYDRDRWMDDLQWFWENVAHDARRAVDYCREKLPRE